LWPFRPSQNNKTKIGHSLGLPNLAARGRFGVTVKDSIVLIM